MSEGASAPSPTLSKAVARLQQPVMSPFGTLPGSSAISWFMNLPAAELLEFALVLLSCVIFGLQTLYPERSDTALWLAQVDTTLQGVFLCEYLLRFYSRDCRPSYLLKWEMLVDALAFLPLLLSLFGTSSDIKFGALVPLRILGVWRFLRDRESFGELVAGLGIKSVTALQLQLARTVTSISTLLFISAGLIYNAEHYVNPGFDNFPSAFYFTLVTLTTVGFGDMTPITLEGRTVVCISILAGATVIPLELSRLAQEVTEAANAEVGAAGGRQSGANRQLLERLEAQQGQLEKLSAKLEAGVGLPISDRVCAACGSLGHRPDAAFCFRCAARLPAAAPMNGAVAGRGKDEEELVAAFRVFDLDDDGFITAEEMKIAMERYGPKYHLTESCVNDIMGNVDEDDNGRIDYLEFVNMMRRTE